MLVPLQWLRDYVDFDLTAEQVAERLTVAGLEVESIDTIGEPTPLIVVGKILSIDKHPNADKLVVCKVDVGDEVKTIVCGASNMKVGDKVPTALVGAEMSGGFRIEKRPLRGVESEGMMCSETELGVGEDAGGLLILPEDAPVGVRFDEYMNLPDTVLDIYVTANRPDCACMVGVARELAAMLGNQLWEPPTEVVESGGTPVDNLTRVDVPDDDLCPRYAARVVTGVTIRRSPIWMAERLRRSGLRPINNVVDATNYVLLELGHPLHAFDYDKLRENRIVARRARAGESITTIDGVDRELTGDMLVIADGAEPVALAGIMGGADSEISEITRRVLLESAYFMPQSIRRTSKTLRIMTEASYRFERGADVELVPFALDRTARLIKELAGGEVARGIVDRYPQPVERRRITLRPSRARRLLGSRMPTSRMKDSLTRLGFGVVESDRNLNVTVPTRRVDVCMETDLIEEVGRLYGFDRLPSHAVMRSSIATRDRRRHDLRNLLRNILAASGFSEAITFSFISPQLAADTGFEDHAERMLQLRKPLSSEQSAMRMSLIPGLLNAVRTNYRRGRTDCQMFEIGRVFLPREDQPLPDEPERIVFAATGYLSAQSWISPAKPADLFAVKGVLETIAGRFGVSSLELVASQHSAFDLGQSFEVRFGDTSVGCLGALSPAVREALEIEQQIFVCELEVDDLISRPVPNRLYKTISQYPPSYRDIAVVVSEQVSAKAIETSIRTVAGGTLSELRLFDLYRGPQVPAGKKSLAYSLTFLHPERTLTDQQIDTVFHKIVTELNNKYGAKLRSQ